MKLYVGNLPFNATEDDVRNHFANTGEVTEVKLITDRETGRPRGFGFVTFASSEDGQRAIEQLDGQPLDGRNLRVNEANDRGPRGAGGGAGGRGGRGGFSGGRGGDRW